MAQVEADRIRTSGQQSANDPVIVAGRAKGNDNLGAALHLGGSIPFGSGLFATISAR